MTKSTITREESIQAVFDLKVGYCLGFADIEILKRVARMALAAMDSEPVAYMTYKGYLLHAGDPKLAEYSEPMPLYADPRPEPISAEPVAWLLSGGGAKNVVVFDGGNAYADPLREVTPLYRHAQPAPVVSAELLHTAASAIEDLLTTNDRTGAFVWFDLPSRLRSAANAQPAPVAPVVPDFKKLARELVDNLVDCGGLDEGVKEKYLEWAEKTCRAAMLAAAPQSPGSEPATVPGKWIPVSERMPDVGVKVLCFPAKDEPIHATFNGQLWLQDISWSVSDEPIDNVITASVTHWMPLPAAPQEVKP